MTGSVLIIAGDDPTGHAGIRRDRKVCEKHEVNHFSVCTAKTFQTDNSYAGHEIISSVEFKKELKCLIGKDIVAVKIGMLGDENVVSEVCSFLKALKQTHSNFTIIWDPVFHSSSGGKLLTETGQKLALEKLLPLVDVITPNLDELLQMTPGLEKKDIENLAKSFHDQFQKSVYLKGGHSLEKSKDVFYDGEEMMVLESTVYDVKLRGTGCVLSTALAVGVAKGLSVREAAQFAKREIEKHFIQRAS
jgi:hydroxymethylpyrimidine kinase/phosphomethylpyrimidine kinase